MLLGRLGKNWLILANDEDRLHLELLLRAQVHTLESRIDRLEQRGRQGVLTTFELAQRKQAIDLLASTERMIRQLTPSDDEEESKEGDES